LIAVEGVLHLQLAGEVKNTTPSRNPPQSPFNKGGYQEDFKFIGRVDLTKCNPPSIP
jgi:hypothetical protein